MSNSFLDELKNLSPKKNKPFYQNNSDKISYKSWSGDEKRLLSEKDFYIKQGTRSKESGYLRWSGDSLRTASNLMKLGLQIKNPELSIAGFELYNAMGLADRESVKKRLTKAVKLNPKQEYINKAIELISNLPNKGNNLENKIISGIFGISVLAGLFFGIFGFSQTGAVIGLNNSSSSLLGVLLFIGGIVGLFFSLK